MNSVFIAAIITAIATIVAAWIMTRQKTDRKDMTNSPVFSQLQEALYEVRYQSAVIRELLGNDPNPDFASKIIDASRSFRNSCDKFQNLVGSHRAFVGEGFYKSAAVLISAASELIESLRRGMSGKLPADQVARDLTERGNHFKQKLQLTEDALAKEVRHP